MGSFSHQQLQSIVAELDQAICSHERWYRNLLKVLISHLSPNPEDLEPDAHHLCRFGQWCESSIAAHLRDHPDFIKLLVAHEDMHCRARKLIRLSMDNQPIPVKDLDLFNEDLDRIRLAFEALKQEFVEKIQNRDPLTGVQNRARMLYHLREQQTLVQRGVQDCALAMLDLDNFKRINDEFGHAAGDAVLISTIQHLERFLRPYDQIYRYGGEEFLLCMPGTTADQGRMVAERMRKAIADQRIPLQGSDTLLRITGSFGIAGLVPFRTVEESIDRADKAMYRAKAAGRNRVEVD